MFIAVAIVDVPRYQYPLTEPNITRVHSESKVQAEANKVPKGIDSCIHKREHLYLQYSFKYFTNFTYSKLDGSRTKTTTLKPSSVCFLFKISHEWIAF